MALQWAPSLHALTAAPAEGSVVLFDAATGRPARTWPGVRGGNFSLQWHPANPVLAIGGAQGSLRLFDAFSDHPLAEACLGKGFVERLGWSQVADCSPRPLAAACGRMVHLRSETLDPLRECQSHGTVLDLDWNPLMEIFVTTHRNGLQMWLPSEERNPVDIDYPRAVLTVRWSPCGWHFAVGNHDATALIIDTKNMGCLRLGGFGGKVSQLAWSADGRHLAVATCDARVAVFEIQTP